MVFNNTFNTISVISWWSVLLLGGTGVPGENHPHVASYWHTSNFRRKWMIKFYAKWGIFSYFMARTNTSSLRWRCPLCTRQTRSVGFLLRYKQQFRASQPLFLLLSTACLAEKPQNTDFYSFWFDSTGDRTHDLPH